MDNAKSKKKPNGKCFSDLLACSRLVIFLSVVLAATCAALLILNHWMVWLISARVSANCSALEELRREGKQASIVNNSATVSSGLSSRGKRAISNTTLDQISDIEKRLKAVDER